MSSSSSSSSEIKVTDNNVVSPSSSTSSSSSSSPTTNNNNNIIIIGCGASGLASAILLEREFGYTVTVYEALENLETSYQDSFPVGVNARGQAIMSRINDDALKALKQANGVIPGFSIMKNAEKVAYVEWGTHIGTLRGGVVMSFYNDALKAIAAGAKIEIKLGHKLVEIDLANNKMTFEKRNNERIVVDYADSRIIDSSGCWSKIRTAMTVADSTFKAEYFPWKLTFRNLFTAENVDRKSVV